ncbi:GspH/FimT family pseudopilin [uncultured Propionivibrio sp.]|uniref:GspH/FimT family pseudopilin n=1 Tax=uncultured Propionivibrio sp. TaxID=426737 RepID=UPI0029BFC685|nr:GspH/FimT family pseudopilin [uncultured Propionivibrio sp.]
MLSNKFRWLWNVRWGCGKETSLGTMGAGATYLRSNWGFLHRWKNYKVMNASRYSVTEGFTTIELIVVIVVLGILSVAAVAKFSDRTVFETRGFADQTLAAIQYARKLAVATGRNVCVAASAGGTALAMTMASGRGRSGACTMTVTNPSVKWRTFSGVSYGAALGVTFAADGTASGTALSLTILGDQTFSIVVETTGYVHCNPVTACE